MAHRLLSFLGGFILILLAHTLLGSFSLLATLAVYGYATYLLFYLSQAQIAFSLLIGVTLGSELLGSARIGQAGFLAVFLCLNFYYLRLRLKATSIFIRFAIAAAFTFLGTIFFLYSFAGFISRLQTASVFFLAFLTIAYLASSFKQPSDYELA